MDIKYFLLIPNLGCFFALMTNSMKTSDVSIFQKEKIDLCQVNTIKKLLASFRMSSDSPQCILQRRRDIEHLISSFVETLFESPNKRASGGEYCCSPKCDKFMSRLGNPNSALIKCMR
ncbi:uncharacterized protein LOC136082264 isoform X1 [Hydra vulgaris]|uniref:Uncharacterized protein LOC136082264 isoform X1 n=2 Tax=Hydra vulgaris TaxID=6087 RepID=A0ABM4C5V8_HYDVU